MINPSKEIIIEALENGVYIDVIPEKYHTEEILIKSVEIDTQNFYYIKEEKRTPAIYLATVKKEGRFLSVFYEKNRTYEGCLAAVEQDESVLKYVPSKFFEKMKVNK